MKGLDVIERNARHQGQLISDLLDISRIMAGKIRLDAQEVDLPLTIESAIESVRLAADAKNVHIKRSVESQNQPVLGDPGRIEQVVCNLLSNAIKFTPGGGHVEVSLTRVGSFVQLAVSDTGDGIDSELLPYLFNRYRQADGSATRRHGGLGLGLTIAKNLVELHGGSIHAHSDGPGQGSTFTVLLPVKAAGIGDTNLGSMGNGHSVFNYDADAPSLAGTRILIVDDEEDARELIGHILRDHGAQVDMVASGEEALKRIESHPPDMLISDIGMPGLDGYTLVKSLRTSSPEAVQQIPAVALTAFARSEDRTRALLSGFQAHIAKPVEAAELVATVASLRYAMLPS